VTDPPLVVHCRWKFSMQEVPNLNMKILSRRLHLAGMVYYADLSSFKIDIRETPHAALWWKEALFIWAASRLVGKKGFKVIPRLVKNTRKISNFLSKIQFQINCDPVLEFNKKKPLASGRILGRFGSRQMLKKYICIGTAYRDYSEFSSFCRLFSGVIQRSVT
jgi:hypothetical protein